MWLIASKPHSLIILKCTYNSNREIVFWSTIGESQGTKREITFTKNIVCHEDLNASNILSRSLVHLFDLFNFQYPP